VVDDEVHEDADATAVRLAHELDEVAARAEPRVDAEVVGDVVAVVTPRRRLKRREPDRVDAERIELVEPAAQPLEVATPVPIRVEVRLDVEAVDDRVLVPEVADHARSTSRRMRYIACDQSSGDAGGPQRPTHGA
jgi:hypothetical protein